MHSRNRAISKIKMCRVVGFEVLPAVVVKNSIFWDITSSTSLKANRRFGGKCRLHYQGRRISQTRNQHEGGWKAGNFTLVSCLAYYSTLKMETIYSSKMLVDFPTDYAASYPQTRTLGMSSQCPDMFSVI
jgi:hypothetical protein